MIPKPQRTATIAFTSIAAALLLAVTVTEARQRRRARPPAPAAAAALRCNRDTRKKIKIGTDTQAASIDISAPTVIDITGIRAWHHAISTLKKTTRNAPEELHAFTVTALLVAYKSEPDNDFHLVLKDSLTSSGRTAVAEIAHPGCTATSAWAAQIADVRAAFLAKFPGAESTSGFQDVNGGSGVNVKITGIGFFDTEHATPPRPRGMPPNLAEIHPIIKIEFP